MIEDVHVFDLETTGLNTRTDRIIEYGGFLNDEEISSLINPGVPIEKIITDITGITQNQIDSKGVDWKTYAQDVVLPVLHRAKIYAGHNIAGFDLPMLRSNLKRVGLTMPEKPWIDTLLVSRRYLKDVKNHKLGTVCNRYGIYIDRAHRAVDDSKANLDMLEKMLKDLFDDIDEALNTYPKRIGRHAVGSDPMIAMIL